MRSLPASTLVLLLALGCGPGATEESTDRTDVVSILGGSGDAEGFARVTGPRPLVFPPDHGAHPETQIEWWYTTGNVRDGDGRRFGFEVTFFRFGLDAAADPTERASAWATRDVYMAHFAVTDVDGERFHAFDRFTRGAAGLAGAEGDPWRVWNEDWSLVGSDGGESPFPLRLRAGDRDDGRAVALDLVLTGTKPLVRQGDRGYSPKGPEPGNASHYYSYPRLATEGTITLGDAVHRVTGAAWFDHEWSTSVLSADLAGWDWFALQLDDGRELMLYELRREDGGRSPFGAGVAVERDGSVRRLDVEDFSIEVLARWTSEGTGATYPSRWRITVPDLDLSLEVVPVLADQELRLTTVYWEGAVDVTGALGGSMGDSLGGSPVGGVGYVELVGYGEDGREE